MRISRKKVFLIGLSCFFLVVWRLGVIFPSYPEGNRIWLVESEISRYYLAKYPQGHNFNVYLKVLGDTLRGKSFGGIKNWLDERFEYSLGASARDTGQLLYELYAYGKVKGACGEYAVLLYWLEEVAHPELEKRVVLSDDHAWLEVKFGDGWVPIEREYPVWLFKFFNHHLFENPRFAFNRFYAWKF